MTIDEAVGIMRGKPGTSLTLTIVRKGESKPLLIPITRDIIKIESVYTKTIEKENILYIRVVSFDKHVKKDTMKALKNNPNVKGIILDLRNNPGGLLNQAVGLTDLFVDKGVIVSQKGRDEDQDSIYSAAAKGTNSKTPMVVLVNGGSASASEIVSGALQDHKRAIIVGQNTFGKGSVQVILPLNQDEALRLTIARYYLPSGRTIQAVGIAPDVTVFPGKVPHKANEFMIKENELKKHLKEELKKVDNNATNDTAQTKEITGKQKKRIITQEDILKDLQLKSAIDALKVLSIKQ